MTLGYTVLEFQTCKDSRKLMTGCVYIYPRLQGYSLEKSKKACTTNSNKGGEYGAASKDKSLIDLK